MKIYKDLLKIFAFFFISLIVYLLLISIFNVFSYKTISVISFILINILFFINGFKFSKVTKYKGFISGIIIGLIGVFIMFIFSLMINEIHLKILTYYSILILSSVIGSIIGVNTKRVSN